MALVQLQMKDGSDSRNRRSGAAKLCGRGFCSLDCKRAAMGLCLFYSAVKKIRARSWRKRGG